MKHGTGLGILVYTTLSTIIIYVNYIVKADLAKRKGPEGPLCVGRFRTKGTDRLGLVRYQYLRQQNCPRTLLC